MIQMPPLVEKPDSASAHWPRFLVSSICLLFTSAFVYAQTQLGDPIDGVAAYDESGGSVALSANGQRLAIGARKNDAGGFDAGQVRVYEWSDDAWVQLGGDINGEAAYDESGYSVAMSSDGSRVAVGAPFNDGNDFDSGHVRVFELLDDTWTQMGDDIDGEAVYDESGTSVALSRYGNLVAIGAPRNDGNGMGSGHVRVYQYTDENWMQLGDDIDGESYGDHFGLSVSLSRNGNRLAVGAPFNINDNGINAGHVRVFQQVGDTWIQVGDDINGEAAYDESGGSVSLSADGERLAIGADGNNDGGMNAGHTRVYQWSEGAWVQLGVDIDGETYEDRSGNSVSLAGNIKHVAIGAYLNDGNGPSSGHTRVFDLSMIDVFEINAGLNDAWFYPATDGQGFFINVFPDKGIVSLAWFTYDTELPPPDAEANLGDAGHRWLTAQGPITGDHVLMNIEMTSGGIFDTPTEIERTDPPGSDGTILLSFQNCNAGMIEYDIPAINRKGVVPIQRVADDNIVLCEALRKD